MKLLTILLILSSANFANADTDAQFIEPENKEQAFWSPRPLIPFR